MNSIGYLRALIPNRYKDIFISVVTKATPVRAKCDFTNIYHCCVYRTGSQWIRRIFSDPRVYCWSGLRPINGARLPAGFEQHIPLCKKKKPEGFPPQTAVTGLYISYENFLEMYKADNYAAFFVVRDPRELVVSWYFSTRYTHPENFGVVELRSKMKNLSTKEGLLFSINYLQETGCFDALKQWYSAGQREEKIKVFYFEDLVGKNGFSFLKEIFSHCKIMIPENRLRSVYVSHAATKVASKKNSDKYAMAFKRNRIKWPEYFDNEIKDYFCAVQPGLLEELGYRW